jgi:hypothetical protein
MITFVSLNATFVNLAKKKGFNACVSRIEYYKPVKSTVFYVSSTNSLGIMDSGFNLALSTILFPTVQDKIQKEISIYGKKNKIGRTYLPIGSSIIVDVKTPINWHEKNSTVYVVCSPVCLIPQSVRYTQNSYYCTMAVLYNILQNCKYPEDDIEIIFTSICCGSGRMSEFESIEQIENAVKHYKTYNATCLQNCVIFEPNLQEQPCSFQNTEWKT